MKEIGGYIEFEHYSGSLLHEDAVALNCGRNCLAYLFKSKGIKKLRLPYFICDSVLNVCERESVQKEFYHITPSFEPVFGIETDGQGGLVLEPGEWLYLVNFYGQLSSAEVCRYVEKYGRVIVDQANDYFAKQIPGADTIYTCRKWFGVADGAFLYTDSVLAEELPQDASFDRMRFLLGRFECSASDFYAEYSANNNYFARQPIKRMSRLTENLLRGIDYEAVRKTRTENFAFLHESLSKFNELSVKPAAFMYPLLVENGTAIRKKLQQEKIYIPTLWPAVLKNAAPESLEYRMAENILPLPVDQRYTTEDMKYMADKITAVL